MPRPLSDSDYRMLAEFRYALRQFLHFSEEAARQAGLTPRQHQALLAVRGFPGDNRVSVGALAERLQVRPHSAVGLVDRLAHEGLLARETDEQDRRRVFIRLTPRGAALLEKLSAAHRSEIRRIGPRIRDLLHELSD